LAVVFSVSVPAGAATVIHVDKGNASCSDTGPGTEATPLCTITAGAGRAVAGDTVLVHSGTYAEQVTVTSSGTQALPITFAEAPGSTVTITGPVGCGPPSSAAPCNGFRINSKSYITVRGFTIADTAGHGINVTKSSNITIEGNEVFGAGEPVLATPAVVARGISLATTTNSIVQTNNVHDNSDSGIFLGAAANGNQILSNSSSNNARGYTRAAAGIDVRGALNTVVNANLVFENEDSGINIWEGAHDAIVTNNVSYGNGDHGVDNKGSNNTRILSNTVYLSANSGIEVVNSTAVGLANNISSENGLGPQSSDGNVFVDTLSAPSITLDYDLLFLGAPGVLLEFIGTEYTSLAQFQAAHPSQEVNGLQADPKFKNVAANNFALAAGSPAIDSANSGVPNHPALDKNGKPRKDDANTANTGAGPRLFDDRGAYEFSAK
jgi:parallel beta-helix repeat protein